MRIYPDASSFNYGSAPKRVTWEIQASSFRALEQMYARPRRSHTYYR